MFTKHVKSLSMIAILVLTVFSLLAYSQPQKTLAATKTTCAAIYSVRGGDTIDSIAKKFNVTWKRLVEANGLKSPYPIYVYQSLCIPTSPPKYQANAPSNAKQPAGDFKAKLKGFSLILTTTNFPKNATYYVKITQPTPPTLAAGKIGLLKTGGKKSVTQKFYLVKNWRKVLPVQVCLKDAHLNTLICRNVTAP